MHSRTEKPLRETVTIRDLREEDIEKLAQTFAAPWSSYEATVKLWQQYFKEQQAGIRTACIIEMQDKLLGYGSLLRTSDYPFFRENGIPEINAIWIADQSRRQGLGTMLIKHIESIAQKEGYKTIGIGVGLYKDYGPAQKLYYKLGYAPDGNGVTYHCKEVIPHEAHPIDDDLILWLTKTPIASDNNEKSFYIDFRPVEQQDRSIIHSWLHQPYVAEWFYGQGLENTLRHLDAFLAGDRSVQYWVGLDQGHPFAFLITSRVDKPHDELTTRCLSEGEAITLDLLIGDMDYLGKGYAVPLIQQFLKSQFPHVDEVLIDPEASNKKAVHVYQKAGFQIVGEYIPSHSPHLHYMMRMDLKAAKWKT